MRLFARVGLWTPKWLCPLRLRASSSPAERHVGQKEKER